MKAAFWRYRPSPLVLLACAAWVGSAVPAAGCVADGQIAVSTNLPQEFCQSAPQHVANAACCSGKASPVWNPSTSKCDTTCDSSNPCDYVTCTAVDQCHLAGTCNPATGVCSNPAKANDTPCSDGNSCTAGDVCTGGGCVSGSPVAACCGNGVVEAGEQCDDGNQWVDPPDGCGVGCTIDATWVCTGQPSNCCLGADVVRFALPELNQNQCQSVTATIPDAGCCQGSHKGIWTGTTCNIVCAVNKCNPPSGWGTPADYGCYFTPCVITGGCTPNDGCTRTQAPAGFACGSSATPCSAQDTCDAGGACQPNDLPAGITCAWTSECAVSQCDGSGGCQDASDLLNGQSCFDGDYCTTIDQCLSGTCVGTSPAVCLPAGECYLEPQCDPSIGCFTPPALAGTPCGNATPQNPCQLGDTCDGNGGCQANPVADGTPCGGSDGSCFTAGSCASGDCGGAAVPRPAGTACGADASLGECDAGDTCDDGGNCLPNLLDASVVCRPGAGACDVEERCDGINPACPADAFQPAGTECGGPSDNCTEPDRCDDAGSCRPCDATTTTTTTLPQDQCAGVTGIPRARCRIEVALANALCTDAIPAKLDGRLRARLERAATRLEAAAASEGKKRARSLKKAVRLLTAVGHKAERAKSLSPSCAGEIGLLVDAVKADAT